MLPIPQDGLQEVLSHWVGRGSIWNVLAVSKAGESDRQWSARDLRARANRILFEKIKPQLSQWPTRAADWVELLPALKQQDRVTRTTPFSGVSWKNTYERFGWPPRAFVGRESTRVADMLLVTAMRWALVQLVDVHRDAVRLLPDIDVDVRRQVTAARQLLERDPVASAEPIMPQQPELLAIRREGAPWGAVATVMDCFRDLEHSFDSLVNQLLIPDDEIRWRLFHLAVLGQLLIALRRENCQVKSVRSLGGASKGPSYTVIDRNGLHWDLWFEASGIWAHCGVVSPYTQATHHIGAMKRPLGADLLLVRRGHRALILECKHSSNEDVVGRNGYLQATTYAAEIRSLLAPDVFSLTVGPEGVMRGLSLTNSVAGVIGSMPPSMIEQVVHDFLLGGGLTETGVHAVAPSERVF